MWRKDFPEGTNPFRFFIFASRPHWVSASLAMVAVIVASTMFTLIAYAFKLVANAAARLPQPGAYQDLVTAVLLYILCLTGGQLIWRLSGFAGARWVVRSRATARHALTAYVTLHSRTYFANRFGGSIANKISHAANGMKDLIDRILWQLSDVLISAIVSFFIAYSVSHLLAWIFFAWAMCALVFNVYLAGKRVPRSMHVQALETRLNGGTIDLLSNVQAMQDFARRDYEITRLQGAIEERTRAGFVNWYFGEWILVGNIVMQGFFGGLMALAAVYLASVGMLSAGDVVLILTLIFRIEGLLLFLGSHLTHFSETWGEIRESLEEIMLDHEIPDAPGAGELSVPKGEIVFDEVRFAYGQAVVFPGLSLHIKGGERVGLVGRSGAGKSTLTRLLLHHHDISAGGIRIDGQDIAKVTQESLRRAVAVVPQESLLFHRTIRENIAYGRPDTTEADIIEAAKRAQAHEFIARLAEGYESLVGERGVKLSGGERQRIAIARAILKDAPILVLDEATASLDSESEVAIQKALHVLMEGKTVIAIAHRLSTLREMDRIIVMDEGGIVEDGSHAQLLQRRGIYSELWNHQAGGFIPDEE